MKKNIIILSLLILSMSGCERDDICIDDITPNLIISFFDFEDIETAKDVEDIEVRIIGILNADGTDSIYTDNSTTITSSTDSIAIPLKITDLRTQFILTTNSLSDTEANIDTLTLDYTTQEIFVGRSCGFKINFNNVMYTRTLDTDNWIRGLEVVTNTIENETEAHVKIFH